MTTALLILLILMLGVVLFLQWKSSQNKVVVDLSPVLSAQERSERGLRDELGRVRTDLDQKLTGFGDSLQGRMTDIGRLQKEQLELFARQISELSKLNETRLAEIRQVVDGKLRQIQEDNAKQLQEMRATVEEKLQGALEKRLGESFQRVSERLEQVHKGLGEMQVLATGVGDLKRVLTNVKSRGGWGEIQLGALLEQMLSPEQYAKNVHTGDGGREMVEFAIKLPGQGGEGSEPVWLPIDSKFPMEDYQRLTAAQDKADAVEAAEASKMLGQRVRLCAKDIRDKYLNPPKTTDFGILFLPTEGLYAEVVRIPGFIETLQREYRVTIAGPTTLTAILNSLQMGFRTLAIHKRSSEVWELLGAVKNEFGKFGEVLDGVKKKLEQASNSMDDAARRSRAIEKRLRNVQALPVAGVQPLLGEPDAGEPES